MTVLTLPSAGLKSDKVPLVDHVDAASAAASPRSNDPNLLECGGEGPRPARSLRHELWAWRGLRLLMAVALCALLVWLSVDMFCRAYDDTASLMSLRRGYDGGGGEDNINGGDGDDDDDATAARVPCKSYTSYAAAEDDMLSMVPSPADAPSDYDAGQFGAMEDVYKKLEHYALNKALTGVRKNDNGGDDDDDDIVSVFNGNVEVSGGVVSPQPSKPPAAVVTKSARFIHDFSVNVTGIVDVEGRRCFVMPLVRDAVSPPASLFDLLFKMSSGYYSMDITKVMADMRVVKPALKDLSGYGLYISKDCAEYSTYRLEKAVSAPAGV